jgi:hypothetical protein
MRYWRRISLDDTLSHRTKTPSSKRTPPQAHLRPWFQRYRASFQLGFSSISSLPQSSSAYCEKCDGPRFKTWYVYDQVSRIVRGEWSWRPLARPANDSSAPVSSSRPRPIARGTSQGGVKRSILCEIGASRTLPASVNARLTLDMP